MVKRSPCRLFLNLIDQIILIVDEVRVDLELERIIKLKITKLKLVTNASFERDK